MVTDIMRYKFVYFAISLVVIGVGMVSLLTKGFQLSIDFTGGSLWEVAVAEPNKEAVTTEKISLIVSNFFAVQSVQQVGDQQFVIRGQAVDDARKEQALAGLSQQLGTVTQVRFETVGPLVGGELLRKMVTALALVVVFIIIYIWRQFKELSYGVSAVVAMLHDSLVMLGMFSLFGWWWGVEIDILFVTALLTTLSFSVHDTIVVYDRIRELRRHYPKKSLTSLVNAAVLQTLSRSINNSMTIIIMLLTLVLLGGETIRWFAVALLVGALTGTYSSTFTAAPLLLLWHEWAARKQKQK